MTPPNRTLSKRNKNRRRPSESNVPADPSRWSEAQFQARIIYEAHLAGWWVYHTYDSRKSQPGWPDLHMYHAETGRKLIVECKVNNAYPTFTQKKVHELMKACGDEVLIWRPQNIDYILKTLGAVGIEAE